MTTFGGILTPEGAFRLLHKATNQNPPLTFSVSFYKKGKKNGEGKNELRTMVCWPGRDIKCDLKGGPPAYNPTKHGLFWTRLARLDPAYPAEVEKSKLTGREPNFRRSISIDGLVRLKIGGVEFTVLGRKHD